MQARLCAIVLLLTVAQLRVFAGDGDETRVFSSGTERVTVIELYTSEGCSSCPPAERWLNRFEDDPALWQAVIPLAFHVDYWDYLGWRDRFAREAFSQRQRRYVREGAAGTVYTPGVFLNGREWLGWRRNAPPTPDSRPAVGDLTVTVDGDEVSVRFSPAGSSPAELDGHVALVGMGLETRIRAGENAGRTLRHEFVVLETISIALDRVAGSFEGAARLPEAGGGGTGRAVVAWVSEREGVVPLQAAGGFLHRAGAAGPSAAPAAVQ